MLDKQPSTAVPTSSGQKSILDESVCIVSDRRNGRFGSRSATAILAVGSGRIPVRDHSVIVIDICGVNAVHRCI